MFSFSSLYVQLIQNNVQLKTLWFPAGRKRLIRMRQQKIKADLEIEDMILREAARIEEELKA